MPLNKVKLNSIPDGEITAVKLHQSGATDGQAMVWSNANGQWQPGAGGGGGMSDIVDDTSPQLGGDLDLNAKNIVGNGNIDINGHFHGINIELETIEPTLQFKRLNNANVPAIKWVGQAGVEGANIKFDGTGGNANQLIFETYDSTTLEERFRITYDGVKATSTDTSVNIGPIINLDRNSASPANWNKTGAIVWSGRNDADESVDYFQINSQIEDVADGTENGRLQFWSMRQGTLQETMFMNSWGDLYFQAYNPKLGWIDHKGTTNDLYVGVNDLTAGRTINFPDADGTLMVADSSTGNVGIGTASPSYKLHSETSSGTDYAGYFRNTSGSGNSTSLVARGGANNTSPNFQVQDYSGNADFTVTGVGKIGIGTASPLRNISVIGSDTSSSGYKDIAEFLEPNITGGTVSVNFGVANSLNNLGKVDFTYVGAGSTDNWVSIGFHSNDNKLKVYANGLVEVASYLKSKKGTIQTVVNQPTIYTSANPVNVWAEISSSYRIDITPRFSSGTMILGTFSIPINPTGASNILMAINPWYSTDGGTTKTLLNQGGPSGSRLTGSHAWFRSSNGFDANDMQNHVVHFGYTHSATTTLTWGFYFRSEGGNTTYFCQSNGNNSLWGWTAPLYMELREVEIA